MTRLTLAAIAAVFLATGIAEAAEAKSCAPKAAPDPSDTIRQMYAAAMKNDKPAMLQALEPDFYAFDGGRRFSRTEFVGIVDMIRAKGQTYAWTVNDPDVHVACDTAWVTYVNRGTVTDTSGTQPRVWLESVVLDWHDGAWKLRFFHSTPGPAQ